jgi:hypothetical protein
LDSLSSILLRRVTNTGAILSGKEISCQSTISAILFELIEKKGNCPYNSL